MTTIKEALTRATEVLPGDSAALDAEVLLAHILNKSRTFLYSWDEQRLTEQQSEDFKQLLARRKQGVPVAYLTGTREFWSLPLQVNSHTLIPRPETELLVELTLALLSEQSHARVLDLGTGSGAIALALASERKDWQITAVDNSLEALKVARKNAERLGFSNVRFCQSDWFSNIDTAQPFDAIIANPPYIAENDSHLLEGDVRFEPITALTSGADGLEALEVIIALSLARLTPEGLLLLEHGFDQKSAVSSMLTGYGYAKIRSWSDLQGNDRVSVGRR